MNSKTILGIETSCDDTSLCLLQGPAGLEATDSLNYKVLYHESFSQEHILGKWGGVVPEVAARNHLAKLPSLLQNLLKTMNDYQVEIDGISVTSKPGLLGPLLTGINLAKTLALYYQVPIFSAHHLQAHIEAIHFDKIHQYPYLGAVLSGGHSAIYLVHSPQDFELLSATIDDACGEALDKGGKMLGLPYPGGKFIDEQALHGDPSSFTFPKVMPEKSKIHMMSNSGLKNALRIHVEKLQGQLTCSQMQDLCASYMNAIFQQVIDKLDLLMKKNSNFKKLPVVIGGGVACSRYLRKILTGQSYNISFVSAQFCSDNAAMIAMQALRSNDSQDWHPFPICLNMVAQSRVMHRNQKSFP